MVKKQSTTKNYELAKITRTLYFFIGFFGLSIIIFDAGNLLIKEAVVDRWSLLTLMFVINTIVWFLSTQKNTSMQSLSIYFVTVSLLIFASFMTYWERGMANTSTILYALPLLVIATIKSRHALIATAALCAGAYSFSAVKYFNDYFNEGYRVQLWGNIFLYSGVMFVCAWLLMVLTGLRKDSK